MTKTPGATSDNGFIFKKNINIKEKEKEKKILLAVLEIITFINLDKHLDGARGTL